MKHDNHVGLLLSRYVEGQLSPDLERQVDSHIAKCVVCRDALARHCQLSADIALVFKKPPPTPDRMARLWSGVNLAEKGTIRSWLQPLIAPVLLSVIVATGLLASGASSVQAAGTNVTITAPPLDTTLAPVRDFLANGEDITQPTAASTSIPVEAITIAPLPAAPTQ